MLLNSNGTFVEKILVDPNNSVKILISSSSWFGVSENDSVRSAVARREYDVRLLERRRAPINANEYLVA